MNEIRCKMAPYTCGWVNPKRRFIFNDANWRTIDDYGLATLRKKLKENFDKIFEVKAKENDITKKPIGGK